MPAHVLVRVALARGFAREDFCVGPAACPYVRACAGARGYGGADAGALA